MVAAKDLAQALIEAGKRLNKDLAQPHNMKLPEAYAGTLRNADNPPYMKPPAREAAAPWNMSEEDLLAQGPDVVEIETEIAGKREKIITLTKTENGYEGLPKTGVQGPGILGVGHDEDGKPIPISEATDILILTTGKKSGRIKALLGTRGDTKQKCTIGGFVDKGETNIQAAAREFIEEAISASFVIDPDLEAAFLVHKNIKERNLSAAEIAALADEHNVPEAAFDEPAIAEFKYQILKHQTPQAVKEISGFVEGKLSRSYKGLVEAGFRNTDDRAIATQQYSARIDMDELTDILGRYDLNLDAESDELGKLELVDLSASVIGQMHSSHGPHILYGLALALENGEIDVTPEIEAQLNDILEHLDGLHRLESVYKECKESHAQPLQGRMIHVFNPEGGDYDRVGGRLSDFTIEQGAPAYDPQPFDFKAYDDDGNIIGEIIGNTNWGLAEIELLHVDPSARGLGIGKALMQKAEEHAAAQDCVSMRVWTPTFEGAGFYDGTVGMDEVYTIPFSIEVDGTPQTDHTYFKAVDGTVTAPAGLDIKGPFTPEDEDYARVSGGLDEYTAGKKAPAYSPVSFAFKAVADNGHVIGELIAKNTWGRVEVELLHVEPEQRGKGTGRALMSAAEEFAKASGAVSVMLRTPTWQGAGFYDGALGYEEVAKLPLDAEIDSTPQYEHTYYKDLRAAPQP